MVKFIAAFIMSKFKGRGYTESENLRKDGIIKTTNKCSNSVDKEKIVCYNMRSLRGKNHMYYRV